MAPLLDRLRAVFVLAADPVARIREDDDGSGYGECLATITTDELRMVQSALETKANVDQLSRDAVASAAKVAADRDGLRADFELARTAAGEAQATADGLLKDVCRLEMERDALAAKLAEVTSGEPFAWGRMVDGKPAGVSYAGDARSGHYDIPLFRAVSSDAELRDLLAREQRMREATRLELVASQEKERAGLEAIAKAQAGIGKLTEERDSVRKRVDELFAENGRAKDKIAALKARVDSLVAGESLTRGALAAAEKDRDRAQRDAREWEEQTQREQASAARAEARVKALESSAEPFAWVAVRDDQPTKEDHFFLDEAEARKDAWQDNYRVEPLYRHPPKPAAETKHYPAWETSGGPNECPHGYAAGIPCQRCDVAKAKPAGEPVAWQANPQPGLIGAITPDKAIAERWASKGLVVRALYKAPPAAQGVDLSSIRTLIEHGKQGRYDLSSFVIVLGNMVRELPAVDLDAVRDAIGVLDVAGLPIANKLRAAIGDSESAREARD